MITRRTLKLLLRAGIPALLIAVAVSRESVISVQVLLAAAAVWIAGTLLWDFVASAAIEPDNRIGLWERSPKRDHELSTNAVGIQTINLLLANAQVNPRAHANTLRPRLIALIEHFLPIRHGFALENDPRRAALLFGDVAWMIDPAVVDRAPTSAELERFFDILLGEESAAKQPRFEEAT